MKHLNLKSRHGTRITRLHKCEVSSLSADKKISIVQQKVNKLDININLKI